MRRTIGAPILALALGLLAGGAAPALAAPPTQEPGPSTFVIPACGGMV